MNSQYLRSLPVESWFTTHTFPRFFTYQALLQSVFACQRPLHLARYILICENSFGIALYASCSMMYCSLFWKTQFIFGQTFEKSSLLITPKDFISLIFSNLQKFSHFVAFGWIFHPCSHFNKFPHTSLTRPSFAKIVQCVASVFRFVAIAEANL